MDRRGFVAMIGGALAAPLVSAQNLQKVARLGILHPNSAASATRQFEFLRAGLRDLGYVEGGNFSFLARSADGDYQRLPALAAELVSLKPDLIVVWGTPATRALKDATASIPIVMIGAGDPVASGLVASLARPGGNITGTSNLSPPLMVKRLELLKEAHPPVRRVAVLLNPGNPAQELSLRAMQHASVPLKVIVQKYEVRDREAIRSAFPAMAVQHADSVVVANDSLLIGNDRLIAELAAKTHFPSSGNCEFAEAGGLIGYGSVIDGYRYAANYVVKILKGARPAELPVEQPSSLNLFVNRKTARRLGITVQRSVLVRADRVIE